MNDNFKYEYVATCLFGLESLLGDEITALGYEKVETIDGRVTFRGDLAAIARCNINLRFAERLFIKMGSFKAETFAELFDGVNALPWENWIAQDDAFPVKGHSIKSALTSIPDCQSIVKKAIVNRLSAEYDITWFKEEGVKYQVEFFILRNVATLMIDTSGVALHKRGYRPVAGVAPLRETLAAAMVKISRPRDEVLLWDPFCGSGTIAIEAAMMMTNTAPGLGREFAAEEFYDLPEKIWTDAREEAMSLKRDTPFEVYASDIDPKMVDLARANIHRADMGGHIKCFVRDAVDIVKADRRATIVCNPPYGERLSTDSEVAELYRNMGKCFSNLAPWQIYILSSVPDFERLYGKRADKVRTLYNGMIKCGFYQYFKNEDFKGRRNSDRHNVH
ncbi:MAG: class I SAM-dependent RNA methyltransferase [Clostridiales bacterium]|nr:class I SAM-dependent RNA methyltransferase [Clostridiales bacterium]